MTDSISMFDMVRRQTLAALWFEAENLVHGNTACLYEHCPHAIDMCDLLKPCRASIRPCTRTTAHPSR